MYKIEELVEEIAYLEEDFFIDWVGKIEEYFYPLALDDIGRLDNSAYDYLLSLNRGNEKLSSEEIDSLIEKGDAYFMEICISRDKLLSTVHFWQYPKGSRGQILNVSEKAFLKEHEDPKRKFMDFARENNLLVLEDKDLKRLVPYEGRMVSIYYKYFDDEYESIREIPF